MGKHKTRETKPLTNFCADLKLYRFAGRDNRVYELDELTGYNNFKLRHYEHA